MTPMPAASPSLRLPAEWEPHEATWLTWPQATADWPGRFQPIPWVFAEMVRRLALGERVRLLVGSVQVAARARGMLSRVHAPLDQVDFLVLPTDRGWMRDSGPAFVQDLHAPQGVAVAGFGFTGWAKYDNHALDTLVPELAAARLGLPFHSIEHKGARVVLEGGAIDVSGAGLIITTEECLLDPAVQVRNPGFTKADYQSVFRQAFGASSVFWLGQGIAGDDTHGHVDDLCRFVNERTLVLCQEKNPADANFRPLAENWERIADLRLPDGSRPEVVALPMPEPLIFDGQRLPASYANFYIGNAAVLAPTFNDPNDRLALGILAELFDRPVIGIHAVDLVWGLGTIHCLTRQEPARRTPAPRP